MGKLYYFSKEKLRFIEARWVKTRFSLAAGLLTLVVLILTFEINQRLDEPLGIGVGRASFLAVENTSLRDQLRAISSRLGSLEKRLTSLNERGNELRLMVDLPKVDDDIRKVGVGGSTERIDLGLSPDVGKIMANVTQMLGRAEREIQMQTRSYNDVIANYEQNQIKFSSIPAIKPMEGFYTIHGFGRRLHPVLRIIKDHEGLDIANDVGTPVYASGDGIIRYAGRTGGGYGILIEIDHGFGYSSSYAHLSMLHVREGQRMRRGDLIAKSGRSGLVSGPHLHYEVRLNGIRQNPLDYFFDDVSIVEYRNQVIASK